jgi:hypothetical protein
MPCPFREKAICRGILDDPATVEHDNSGGEGADGPQIVGYEEEGDPSAGVDAPQQIEQLDLDRRVESRDGFVSDHEPRTGGQGSSKCHASPLTA